jgi:RimJ/RimL family protein N-acetyltransferase
VKSISVPPSHLQPTTDGLVTIRPPGDGDGERLVAGRDAEFHRFLCDGDPHPQPLACIESDGQVIGWVDYDVDRAWLEPGEVNIGYHVFAAHRGRGWATRAVKLLLHHLSVATEHRVATFLIDAANVRSLALAGRVCGDRASELDGHPYFKVTVPPLTYGDGTVTLRPITRADVDRHLDAIDDEQIDRLWLPGQREDWEAMTPAQQRAHVGTYLGRCQARFATGPKWVFAADTALDPYVAYVDVDLANPHVPSGNANISYSAHPAHRGQGYVSRAVRLAIDFLRDHTAARTAHVLVDERNEASLRVARAVGAIETERMVGQSGNTMIRHVLEW